MLMMYNVEKLKVKKKKRWEKRYEK